MRKDKQYQHILITSFIMTVAIFVMAIFISYWLDFERIDEINSLISEYDIDKGAFLLEQSIYNSGDESRCPLMKESLEKLNKEIIEVGKDLSRYGDKSLFKKQDFNLIRREYFLLQLKFFFLTKEINEECGRTYVPIIYFYDSDDPISERQGYVLNDISDYFADEVSIVTLDREYEEEPIIKYLIDKYNVTSSPTIIVDEKIIFRDLVYTGELNQTILNFFRIPDPYAPSFDPIFSATGVNKTDYANHLKGLTNNNISEFAKGDIYYILGRITQNESLICESLRYYDSYNATNLEEQAIIYETYASVGCGRNRKAFLLEAAKIWEELGNSERARIERSLVSHTDLKINISSYDLNVKLKGKHSIGKILIGNSGFSIDRNDLLLSQVDRVSRDWLSYQLNNSPFSEEILTVFSERLYYDDEELLPEIGWHEGGRINEIKEAGIPATTATGTMVVQNEGKWYAPNEKGDFIFEVPWDKVYYPTTRFLSENVAVIIDTHGINMLVEQSMRKNATLIIGCCDNIGKIRASKYLADKGKKVVCFTDKYLPLILGYNGSVLGSPPFIRNGNSIIFGHQPIKIDLSETIIASNVSNFSAVQSYYDTPSRYFNMLSIYSPIKILYYNYTTKNDTPKMVDLAIKKNATVIGARVFNSDDYYAMRYWLNLSKENKAVFFHSYSYPYGYKIIKEFPEQTTFDDIYPVLI